MSEYQYYRFESLESNLSSAQHTALRSISGRAEITTSSFRVLYNYSDLKAEPVDLMFSHFDIGFYYADWGMIDIYIKLPQGTLSEEFVVMADDETMFVYQNAQYQLLIFSLSDSEHCLDDEDADLFFENLSALRSELIEGDYRLLYLSWFNQLTEEHKAVSLPLINLNFNKLSLEQRKFVDLFYVSPIMIKALSLLLKDVPSHSSKNLDLSPAEKVSQLTAADKDSLLCLLFETGHLYRSQAMQHLRKRHDVQPTNFQYWLTAAMLEPYQTIAEQHVEQERAEAESNRLKQARHAKELRLNTVFSTRDTLWANAHQEAERSCASGYKNAASVLLDLFEAYTFKSQPSEFVTRFRLFIKQHTNRKALLKRLEPIINKIV